MESLVLDNESVVLVYVDDDGAELIVEVGKLPLDDDELSPPPLQGSVDSRSFAT